MSIKTKSAKYDQNAAPANTKSKVLPLMGYRKSADGRMEPNPETAAVVQLIFPTCCNRALERQPLPRELFKRGIPTPPENTKQLMGRSTHDVSRSRGRWSGATVLRILEDERYIGSYVIGRRAVIEVGGTRSRRKGRDKWVHYSRPSSGNRGQKNYLKRRRLCSAGFPCRRRKTREYPLKGKVYCGCCDHTLSPASPQKKPFYMCRHSTADVNSRLPRCSCKCCRGLEEAVLLTLKKQLEILLPVHEDGIIQPGGHRCQMLRV